MFQACSDVQELVCDLPQNSVSQVNQVLNNRRPISSGNRVVSSGNRFTSGNRVISNGNRFISSGNRVLSGGNRITSGGNRFGSSGNRITSGSTLGGNRVSRPVGTSVTSNRAPSVVNTGKVLNRSIEQRNIFIFKVFNRSCKSFK